MHFDLTEVTSESGTNAKCRDVRYTVAIGGKAEVTRTSRKWRDWPISDLRRCRDSSNLFLAIRYRTARCLIFV